MGSGGGSVHGSSVHGSSGGPHGLDAGVGPTDLSLMVSGKGVHPFGQTLSGATNTTQNSMAASHHGAQTPNRAPHAPEPPPHSQKSSRFTGRRLYGHAGVAPSSAHSAAASSAALSHAAGANVGPPGPTATSTRPRPRPRRGTRRVGSGRSGAAPCGRGATAAGSRAPPGRQPPIRQGRAASRPGPGPASLACASCGAVIRAPAPGRHHCLLPAPPRG